MAIFGTTYNDFTDLLKHQLYDLNDAFVRMQKSFGDMADKAADRELSNLLTRAQSFADQHAEKLKDVFRMTGIEEGRETCEATKGLVKEASDTTSAGGDSDVIDAALVANAQRLAHYLIAGLGTVRNFSRRAGHPQAAEELQSELDSWYGVDRDLTALAESRLNMEAVS